MQSVTRWIQLASRLKDTALWRNRFYAFGLVAQKGFPVLILPLLVSVFGRDVYGDYVLLYTVIQIYAMISCLAIPQAVVPMWYRQTEPLSFITACIVMLGGLALSFGILLVAVAHLIGLGVLVAVPLTIPMILAWIIVFALSYNMNALGIALVRIQDRQSHFFWAAVSGSLILMIGVAIVAMIKEVTLTHLLTIQLLSIIVTAVLSFGKQPLSGLIINPSVLRKQWRPLLRFSFPLTGYSLVVLFSMSLDKWIARLWFSRDIFNTYIIDYQCAFAILFIPTAINLYNGPRISAFVAAKDRNGLLLEERKANRLTVAGCSVVVILMYFYSWITGLGLSKGYWLLAIGFMFEGLYGLRVNRLMAELRSFRMLFIAAIGIAVYIILLGLAAISASRPLLYMSAPIYLTTTFSLVYFYTRNIQFAGSNESHSD